MKRFQLFIVTVLIFASCKNTNTEPDAYGNFEAIETIVSVETPGKIISMNVKQGDVLEEDHLIAVVDSNSLLLSKNQLAAQINASQIKKQTNTAQVNVLKEQRKNAEVTRQRVLKMFEENAATKQQTDDINGQINVIEKQIIAANTQQQLVEGEIEILRKQQSIIDDQIKKCSIISPTKGTVLETYLEKGELATPGKPILKLADISVLELKVYVSGNQLSNVLIGKEVKVYFDSGKNENNSIIGKINWISSESEFTPRIIQTKEERIKLMYAVKISVENDGRLKIGMPGEVIF